MRIKLQLGVLKLCQKAATVLLNNSAMYSISRKCFKTSVCSGALFQFSRPFLRPWRCIHVGESFTVGSLDEIQILKAPVPLASRKYLASSHSPGFPQFLSGPRKDYPLLVKAKHGEETGLLEWSKRARHVIDEAYKRFEQDGTAVAILFRGLLLKTIKDYSQWVNNLGFEPFAYKGGITARNEIEVNVADGAADPSKITIEPHSEMAYSPNYPKIFTIFTLQKATRGGETAICDVREILANLDAHFLEKISKKGIRYTHFLHDESSKSEHFYKSWQDQFLTRDKEEVETFLNERGYSFEWHGKDLYYYITRSPFVTHPRNGEKLWFNSAATMHCSYFIESAHLNGKELPNHQYTTNSMYGDGEPFAPGEIEKLRSIIWQNAVGFDWQNGDVLFLDQLIVQHSRLGFEGERKVGVSLFTY